MFRMRSANRACEREKLEDFSTARGDSEPKSASHAISYAKNFGRSRDAVIQLRCGWQRDRDARALIVKHVFGLPICLGRGELLCQVVLPIWNSFRALVFRNKAQFQGLMEVD